MRALAIYKIAVGALMCAMALELMYLLGQDIAEVVHRWILRVHVDPHNPLIAAAIGRAESVTPLVLEEYASVAGTLGGIHLVEGFALWKRRHWGEYLCIVSTALLVPLEVQEILHAAHVVPMLVLALNVAVIWFLVRRARARAIRPGSPHLGPR